MTQEEAITRLLCDVQNPNLTMTASGWDDAALLVNQLVALGILKLDEPRSKAMDFARDLQERGCSVSPHDVEMCLAEANLKIVEK